MGAFYKRFDNKEALLPYLLERILREQNEAIENYMLGRDWTGAGLRERLGVLLSTSLQAGRLKRGLLRALVVRQLLDPESMSDRECEESQRQFTALVDWLCECADEVRHPDPSLAVRLSVMMTVFAIHQRVLSPTNPRFHEIEIDDEQFARELADSAFAYLQFDSRREGCGPAEGSANRNKTGSLTKEVGGGGKERHDA